MVEESESRNYWLSHTHNLVHITIEKTKATKSFIGRWKSILLKVEEIPKCISDLSSHPLFTKNSLCLEQMQSISTCLDETIHLAEKCSLENVSIGKLQMQSNLDSLIAKLDLCIKDCKLLIKSGVLGESNVNAIVSSLARLQIGDIEAKHKAVDYLQEALQKGDKNVTIASLSRSNINALVQLLTASSVKIREKAVSVINIIAESGNCESLLVAEGVTSNLIRLIESGSIVAIEKSVLTLQTLSTSDENAKLIAGHGGILPLIELSQNGDSISQFAAVGTLTNLSTVPELRKNLADEGIICIMVNILEYGNMVGLKEYASECLQNLSLGNDDIKKAIVSEGAINSILKYIDSASPHECAIGLLRNLVCVISTDSIVSLEIIPRIAHVLKEGSVGAKQAAASTICKISGSTEMKRLLGEYGCLPLLVNLLESNMNVAREVATQAIASLMSCKRNRKEIRKDERCVSNLVQLLDPNPQNTAKKYAVCCLLYLGSSKKCRRIMISYGAVGYLKKLSEIDVPGRTKLLESLERGNLRSLFGR